MQLHKLKDSVYFLPHSEDTDRPILGLVTGFKSSLVIDAGNSLNHAQQLLNQSASVIQKPIKHVVLTHWHWDHIFGAEAFNAKIIANSYNTNKIKELSNLEWTNQALDKRVESGEEIPFCSEHIKKELPDDNRQISIVTPNTTIDGTSEIDLGGITCQLINVSSDHNPESTIVYIPEQKIMFLGDILYMDMHNGDWSYTTEKIYPLIDKIEEFDVDYYLSSHQDPIDNLSMRSHFLKLRRIGRLADTYKGDKAMMESDYHKIADIFDQEAEEIIDAFVAGWKKKQFDNHKKHRI